MSVVSIRVQLSHLQTAVLPHVSKDDSAPVLMKARLSSLFGTDFTLTATDRYTCAEYVVEGTPDGEDHKGRAQVFNDFGSFLVGMDWLRAVAALKPSRNRAGDPDWVDIEVVNTELPGFMIVTRYGGISFTFEVSTGNFPPVDKLMVKAREDVGKNITPEHHSVGLGWKMLKKLDMFGVKVLKDSPYTFTLTRSENPNKPGPVLVTSAEHPGFTALIQPNLLTK